VNFGGFGWRCQLPLEAGDVIVTRLLLNNKVVGEAMEEVFRTKCGRRLL
jgi:hypothetical protein